jgi:aldose sugar dehydrogenase
LGFSTVFTQVIHAEPTISDPTIKVELVVGGLSSPTSRAFVDSQSIIVLEKNIGKVRLVSNGELKDEPILRLDVDSTIPTCCRGLLGIAVSTLNEVTNIKEVFIYFSASGNN